LRFEVTNRDPQAMDGAATLKQVAIYYGPAASDAHIRLSLFIPNDRPKPVPGFLLICHRDHENIDPTRQRRTDFWPAETLINRGYAAAAFHVEDVDPDEHDGFENGAHGLYDPEITPRPGHLWGTIAAWAWGGSRVMDYLETDPDVNADRFAVVGHSRGGKAALWCGATDPRFALTISNNSGCTGAALARRKTGERVKQINDKFPHWFCDNYTRYNGKEDELPVDQHQLIALMAPRLVYVASAARDDWADPLGEFLSCLHADPVYQLYNLTGMPATQQPPVNQPVHGGHIGYHIRSGKHDLTQRDWNHFLDYADQHFPES
jgi:hypothetical protein